MSNFDYLKEIPEFNVFSSAAMDAEELYNISPSMCVLACRKAMELGVKWVYSVDKYMKMPYRDNLSSLVYEPSFKNEIDPTTWEQISFIIKVGNIAAHTNKHLDASEAILALRGLFDFIDWINYCYGETYTQRKFDENLIPTNGRQESITKDKLLNEKEITINELQKKLEAISSEKTAAKKDRKDLRVHEVADISEYETRKKYIDVDLKLLGWKFEGADQDVRIEYEVNDMDNKIGQKGFVDYVLMGKDGIPLALIEAKRTSKDANIGRYQAQLYADALERKFRKRPMIFLSNGFDTKFWDDKSGPQRNVSGFFSKSDLEKLLNRRDSRRKLSSIQIDTKITDRYYQMEAIRAVCDHIEQNFRKNLLVMATGTGKTRTASSLTDVLSRGGYVTNILFLADRTALVKQAKDDFKNYLPDMSLCNLCSNKDDANARIVFSTYPTMLNAIDTGRAKDGTPLFSPAHFDLIIIDESHRSIFQKYRLIFEYFDAILVGLTATPKEGVDSNTYTFFEMEHRVPTYAYDYETAVYKDNVLVPYYNYEVDMKFHNDGIVYDDLSDEDKAKYEDDFAEDDYIPPFIPPKDLNKFIFNENTVDKVLQDLMERGIKIKGGDQVGKTIIFAQNKMHAEFILERFNKLYPRYNGTFASRVVCDDSYAQTVIDKFKRPDSEPYIAVSVDMMDTGIDVPECVNLVFFKSVKSKIKFWQMIGRGTRLCPSLVCRDSKDGEYTGKKRFLIFDYCGNFEFFREKMEGFSTDAVKSLSEQIYSKQIKLIVALQDSVFMDDGHANFRKELVADCHGLVNELVSKIESHTTVRMEREYVEKYGNIDSFNYLSDTDKVCLIDHIAPLIFNNETDEYAKRFDNFMYGLMLTHIEKQKSINRGKKTLVVTAEALLDKQTIPQIKEKLVIINRVASDEFWNDPSVLDFEYVRKELRDLIKFLRGSEPRKPIIIDYEDPIIDEREGIQLEAAYDFEDYRKKVNRYVEENGNILAIHKLKHNIPLAEGDYKELERILTHELGSIEDYQREYGDTPFGLLVRKIAKLDHDAAMEAFATFINDASLNQNQITFVNKIINHIEQNGYMDNIADLQKPPFDKPVNFIKMFDADKRDKIIKIIRDVKDNALINNA